MNIRFYEFINSIKQLPKKSKYDKRDLLVSDFLLEKEKNIEIFYSPHNEHINMNAKIVIIGITPGWFQMEKAIRTAKQMLEENISHLEILEHTKLKCRFAGTMRKNLISMLDELNLHEYLGLQSSSFLFDNDSSYLHTTSLIKYPVFINGLNYNGHNPRLDSTIFHTYIEDTFHTDISCLHNPLIIPLGKSTDTILYQYIEKGMLDLNQCLLGFPHPSGANGHRQKQLTSNKLQLTEKISLFFS